MSKIILVAMFMALACHAQIFRLNLGQPQNCATDVSPQLAYVHQVIAPTYVPTQQPTTRVCECGHNQVPVSQPIPIVTPVIPQPCGPTPPIVAPVQSVPVPSPAPQYPSQCNEQEGSSRQESNSQTDSHDDDHKGKKCDNCDKDEKNCKCGSCTCKDSKKLKEDDKVKDVVNKGGKSCDKCKGGKCQCASCKCDSCKDKPINSVIKPILGLIHH